MMEKLNPCDACKRKIGCSGCVFNVYPTRFTCENYSCCLNVDGMCVVSLYDECYAREGAKPE